MIDKETDIKNQFNGFIHTPNLWIDDEVCNLTQIEIPHSAYTISIQEQDLPKRLGNRVEQFLFEVLSNSENIEILTKNLQIVHKKVTLGELDILLLEKNIPIHLEIICKFYLFDKSVGDSELDHWIGPNRKDSLINKLRKLKDKQLPLLFNPVVKNKLRELGINFDYKQKICFKAQLFIPYCLEKINFKILNENCIKGYYLNVNQLDILEGNEFYMPTKLNWLSDPYTNVEWTKLSDFKKEINHYTNELKSPLCWMKSKDASLSKIFIVWW